LNSEPIQNQTESNPCLNINKADIKEFFTQLTSQIVTEVATQLSNQPSRASFINNDSEIIIGSQLNEAEANEVAPSQEVVLASSSTNISNNETEENYSVQTMLNFANEKKFPKRLVNFGELTQKLTPILHFFEIKCNFNSKPNLNEKILFVCKLKQCQVHAYFGNLGNLNKHLKRHDKTRNWYKLYTDSNINSNKKPIIDDVTLNIVKLFLTTNTSFVHIKNKYLNNLIYKNSQVSCSYEKLRYDVLPHVVKLLKSEIDKKCNKALSVSLIPDCWTAICVRKEFLGNIYIIIASKKRFVIIFFTRVGRSTNIRKFRNRNIDIRNG
jgi:hypothetical protein